jgi:hypothetical protein
MQIFQFAAAMEASIRQESERLADHAPDGMESILTAVAAFQAEFELLIDRAQYTKVDTGSYPEVKPAALLGADSAWQGAAGGLKAAATDNIAVLTILWQLYSLVEKSGQFYQQAALNSAHPSTRLYLSSLAEVKGMLRRRLDSLLRVVYNEVWAAVGFAPFILGKD